MRSQVVLSAEDEEVLWWVLQRHAAAACTRGGAAEDADGGPGLEGEPGLNYDEFTQVRVYFMLIDTSSCMMYHQRLLPWLPLDCTDPWWWCACSTDGAPSPPPSSCLCRPQVAAECGEAIGPAADVYFQASTFLRLARDAGGRVPAAALFRYCVARSTQIQLVRQGAFLL